MKKVLIRGFKQLKVLNTGVLWGFIFDSPFYLFCIISLNDLI